MPNDVKLPPQGIPRPEVLETMRKIHTEDANWKDGRTWSLVYYAGDEHTDFIKAAHNMFFSENALNPMAFPSLRRFEAETVSMAAHMLGGDENTVGAMTTGGTESILMAVKTYRDWARATKPHIKQPEMVLPTTIHPAFEKAAHYFDVKAVHVPVHPSTFRADLEATKKAITENTILLAGSAPSYPHGVTDPIPALAALAAERGLGFHTDSCLGGFLLPFVKKLGRPAPDFDFSVPGVTSISADLHKYGFTAKGASLVLYRSQSLRQYQFFIYADWCGGIYASPSMTGTRAGGAIAASWATLMAMGESGYLENARRIMKTTKELMDGITAIPGLRILGQPDMSVFAFGADELDMVAVGDAMDERRWRLDRLQNPNALHMMVTMAHEKIVEPFLADLRDAVAHVRAHPDKSTEGMAAMYGMMASLPDRGAVRDVVMEFMDGMYRA